MSNEQEAPSRSITQSVSLLRLPSFMATLFLVFSLTGNCGMCGFDRDYVGEAVSR